MLKITELSAHYGSVQALRGVNLGVNTGEIVTLIGANGAGKSTLMNTIFGYPRASGGMVEFDGQNITNLPSHAVGRLDIAVVPEGRRIFQRMTVLENLHMGDTSANRRTAGDLERIYEMFPILRSRVSQRAGTLSGGEQQMLAIGRALMTNPRLLILDEATEGLAPLIREEIWSCLSMLKSRGQSVLVIDKNVENLTRIADRHYIIERGCTVWSGTSAQLTAEPDLQHRYLGI